MTMMRITIFERPTFYIHDLTRILFVSSGMPAYSMAPRSVLGPSSPAASETNSVRSDSPGLSGQHRQQQQHRQHLMTNGLQTPPPLPPRAPINTGPAQRGQTPPPSGEATILGQQVHSIHCLLQRWCFYGFPWSFRL